MRIWSNPSRHCRATTLPSSCCTGDSHADSSLGGGSPTYIVAAGGVPGAGAPPDAIPTAPIPCEFGQTLAAIAEPRRCHLAAAPETPTPIHRLEEDPPPTSSPPEASLEPKHHRTPSPLPLKTARAASSSPASRGPFSSR
jgi:hypothetical protein